MVTSHSITLNDLSSGTTYYYRLTSADSNGNSTTDNNGGAFYAFTIPSNNFVPPPSSGSSAPQFLEIDESKILLNNNSEFTKYLIIDIALNLSGISSFRIGDSSNLNDQGWQGFVAKTSKSIGEGDGKKSIYFQFMNGEGLTSKVIEKTIVLDTNPPSAPTNFTVKYIDNYLEIGFQKPSDGDVAGFRLFKSESSFITDPFGNEQIIMEGRSESTIDKNVNPQTKYYYSVFSYDYVRNYSSPAVAEIIIPPYVKEEKEIIATDKGIKTFEFEPQKQNLEIEIGNKLEDLSISQKTFRYLENSPINITIPENDFLKKTDDLVLKVGMDLLYGLKRIENVWTAKIDVPGEQKSYLLTLEVIKEDGTKEIIELGQVLVDPFGHVYQDVIEPHLILFKNGFWSWEQVHKKNMLEKVKVFLYQYNDSLKDWQLFEASRYGQRNPQITDKEGAYGFLVPRGLYYLEAIKIGFGEKDTESFEVKNQIINRDIELSSVTINWWYVDENREVILLIILPILFIIGIIIVRAIKKRKKIKVIYDGFSIK
ncbi:MAG: hypothetical protein PHS27_02105 [Candidatus Pacebacteria bacterium]|nr:hypothetical protein [Candidatus Paceibacterota bacterium]